MGDRGGIAPAVAELRSRAAAALHEQGDGGEVVREEQGMVPPFYSSERSRGRGVEAVGEGSVAGGH
jgi:hypothetical protein